jgi:hypothetical protein
MGISPDEDLTSNAHVAHGLEVSSQTNNYRRWGIIVLTDEMCESSTSISSTNYHNIDFGGQVRCATMAVQTARLGSLKGFG